MCKKLTVILAAAALLLSLGGCVMARRLLGRILPGTPAPTAASAEPTKTHDAESGLPASRQDILDVFREIAFDSEYGGRTNSIRKWSVPIRAAVHGAPTDEDLAALDRAMGGLNGIDGFPGISLTEGGQNMDIWFVPLEKMKGVVPGYVEGNWGFFSVSAARDGITSSTVAIATDITSQEERSHLIFEEVLQSTGLMKDSDRYDDSIFYGKWTTVQQPTQLDWQLLDLLYNPKIMHGMGVQEAMRIIEGLLPAGPDANAATAFGWETAEMVILQYTHAC